VSDEQPTPASSRRRFLLATAALAGGSSGGIAWWITKDTPDRWDHVEPFLTEPADFYNRYDAKKRDPIFWWIRLTKPKLFPIDFAPSPEPWSLTITGEVREELTITQDDLQAEADRSGSISLLKTLRCAGDRPGNRLASTAVFTGVPFRPFVMRARPKGGAVRLRIFGEDGFTNTLRLDDLADRGARPMLLAWAMNGQPMPHERGGPIRLVAPDRFGFKNIKWPQRIEVTSNDSTWGNHEVDIAAGTDDGLETMGSKILTPDLHRHNPVADTHSAAVQVRGMAFGHAGAPVGRVDVRIDDGDWRPAMIEAPEELRADPLVREALDRLPEAERPWPMLDVWTPWTFRWTAPGPGEYRLAVRVTTADGQAQEPTDIFTIDGFSEQATGVIRVL
jgi:DMSO/TMAO reductase YedYZ molybdopterin-dependent catalytic subunit